jgi:hypothetical protein
VALQTGAPVSGLIDSFVVANETRRRLRPEEVRNPATTFTQFPERDSLVSFERLQVDCRRGLGQRRGCHRLVSALGTVSTIIPVLRTGRTLRAWRARCGHGLYRSRGRRMLRKFHEFQVKHENKKEKKTHTSDALATAVLGLVRRS